MNSKPPGPRPTRLLLALGLLLVLGGCGGLDPRETEVLERGTTALEHREWAQAKAAFTELLSLRPDYHPALLDRAGALFHLGEWDAALDDLRRFLARGGIEPEEEFRARYLEGRALIGLGRSLIDDTRFRAGGTSAALSRSARELFMNANLALRRALEISPSEYEALLWRAYALYRQENHRGALTVLQQLSSLQPNDWRHKFFRVLATENLRGLDEETVERVIELAAAHMVKDAIPIFSYLVDIHDEVPPEAAARIEALVERFQEDASPDEPLIARFIETLRDDRRTRSRRTALEDALARARELARAGEHAGALGILERYETDHSADPRVRSLHDEVAERWSQVLEVEATGHLGDGGAAGLRTALAAMARSRDLARSPDRKIALLKETLRLEALLREAEIAAALDGVGELLRESRPQDALEKLQSVPPGDLDGASEARRRFLLGSAYFFLESWNDAALAFSGIPAEAARRFEELQLLHGLALARSGRRSEGILLLEGLPRSRETDEARRLLAAHCAASGRPLDALAYLSRLEAAGAADRELEATCRGAAGVAMVRERRYGQAIEHLVAAAGAAAGRGEDPPATVLVALGEAYHATGQLARSREVLERAVRLGPSPGNRAERRDAHLLLARLHLGESRQERAYEALEAYRALDGTVPDDLLSVYGELVAKHADFMPLDRIVSWRYARRTRDRTDEFVLRVAAGEDGRYRVERQEGAVVLEETWTLQGRVLVLETGDAVTKLPLNFLEGEGAARTIAYSTSGQAYRAEVVRYGVTVSLPGGRTFERSNQVEALREIELSEGRTRRLRQVIFLAPGVGEVKRQVFEGEERIAEIVLLEVVHQKDASKP